jgi:hypothetical protein
MPVLSLPGALVGGDEVTMAVFHELSRAEGPSQQGRKTIFVAHAGVGAPHLPVSVPAQFFMKFRGPKAHSNRQRIPGKERRKFMSVSGLAAGDSGGRGLFHLAN